MGCVSQKNNENRQTLDKVRISSSDEIIMTLPDLQIKESASGYQFTPVKRNKSVHEQQSDNRLLQKVSQIFQHYELCIKYYEQHNLDNSYAQLQKIKIALKQNIQIQAYLNQYRKMQFKNITQKLKNIQQQYQTLILFSGQINRIPWNQISNNKGIKISVRNQENEGGGVMIQSIIDIPFQVFITTVYELDLYKDFLPFIEVSTQEKYISRNCKIGYAQAHFPIVTIRQTFYQGVGYDRLNKDNSVFLYTRSIQNLQQVQKKLKYQCKINKKYVQFDYKYIIVKYEPIDNIQGKITIVINVMKVSLMPDWLWNKIIITFGNGFFKNLINVSKNYKGSKWQKNTQLNPDAFNFFKKILQQHVKKRQTQQNKSLQKQKS